MTKIITALLFLAMLCGCENIEIRQRLELTNNPEAIEVITAIYKTETGEMFSDLLFVRDIDAPKTKLDSVCNAEIRYAEQLIKGTPFEKYPLKYNLEETK